MKYQIKRTTTKQYSVDVTLYGCFDLEKAMEVASLASRIEPPRGLTVSFEVVSCDFVIEQTGDYLLNNGKVFRINSINHKTGSVSGYTLKRSNSGKIVKDSCKSFYQSGEPYNNASFVLRITNKKINDLESFI